MFNIKPHVFSWKMYTYILFRNDLTLLSNEGKLLSTLLGCLAVFASTVVWEKVDEALLQSSAGLTESLSLL